MHSSYGFTVCLKMHQNLQGCVCQISAGRGSDFWVSGWNLWCMVAVSSAEVVPSRNGVWWSCAKLSQDGWNRHPKVIWRLHLEGSYVLSRGAEPPPPGGEQTPSANTALKTVDLSLDVVSAFVQTIVLSIHEWNYKTRFCCLSFY